MYESEPWCPEQPKCCVLCPPGLCCQLHWGLAAAQGPQPRPPWAEQRACPASARDSGPRGMHPQSWSSRKGIIGKRCDINQEPFFSLLA